MIISELLIAGVIVVTAVCLPAAVPDDLTT